MKATVLSLFLLLIVISQLHAQDVTPHQQKGSIYFTWGYHADAYSKSSIRFKNNTEGNYNFTLYNATANDRSDLHCFFNKALTVPQYVINVGYLFNNKSNTGIELSFDHLKYLVVDNQQVHLKGTIQGVNYDKDTIVSPDFVHLEHTNGNNYLSLNFVKKISLLKSINEKRALSGMVKAGVGLLTPMTTSTVLNEFYDAPLNISGWVVSTSANLRYEFYKYFFLEAGTKVAFADYTRAILGKDGRAKHHFYSIQYIGAAGIIIPLKGK
jgi:hypothetical protein